MLDQRQRIVEIFRLFIQIPGAQPKVDTTLLAFNVQRTGTGKGGRQRLCPAHATKPGRQNPSAGQIAVVMLTTRFDKGFIGALHDALAADVNPAAGCHLAVHHQARAVELVEVFPIGPLRDQVGVREQNPWRTGMGAEHAHRLARLDQQGFIRLERTQTVQYGVKTWPVARCLANTAIDDELIRVFSHFRVEVVLQHAVGRLNLPVGTTKGAATRRADRASLAFKVRGLGQIRHGELLIGHRGTPTPGGL